MTNYQTPGVEIIKERPKAEDGLKAVPADELDKLEAAEKPPTKEELESETKSIMEGLGYKHTPKPTEEKKKDDGTPSAKEDKAKDEDKKPETETKDTKKETEAPKPAPKPKPAPSPKPAVTAEDVANKVVQKLAEEKPKEEKKPEAVAETLSPRDRRTKEALTVLAEQPEYKDAPANFDRFLAAEKKYETDWRKENPNKKFNSEDEEHNDFYDTNEPRYDEEAFEEAKEQVVLRKAEKTTKDMLTKKDEEQRYQQTLHRAGERVKAVQVEAEANLIHDLDPAFEKVNTLEALTKEDPVAGYVVKNLAWDLKVLTSELELLYTPGLNYKVDEAAPKPAHSELLRRMNGYETELQKYPEEKLVEDGRAFATVNDYSAMTPAEREGHWSIYSEPEYVKKLLVADFSGQAKRELATIRPEKNGGPKHEPKTQPAETPKRATTGAVSDLQAEKETKRFPNTAGGSDQVPTEANNGDVTKKDWEIITTGLFS